MVVCKKHGCLRRKYSSQFVEMNRHSNFCQNVCILRTGFRSEAMLILMICSMPGLLVLSILKMRVLQTMIVAYITRRSPIGEYIDSRVHKRNTC
jgi:hypothetical protein